MMDQWLKMKETQRKETNNGCRKELTLSNKEETGGE